jgi:hypothetical protein
VKAEWVVCGLDGEGWWSGDDVGAVPRLKVFEETVRGVRWVVLEVEEVVVAVAVDEEDDVRVDDDEGSSAEPTELVDAAA